VPSKPRTRWVTILGCIVGGLYLALGVAEFATHLDEPLSLMFWMSSLWGGGALVLYGIFGRAEVSTRLVIAGALLGVLATAWTLLVPLLAVALVVFTIRDEYRGPAAS
jgi:hypothetical protein